MIKFLILYILLLADNIVIAQDTVRVLLDNDFEFRDGVFLNFSQVVSNTPIDREQILTDIDKDAIDFYEKLMKQDFIRFIDSGTTQTIDTKQIWGFCDEGTLFIHWGDDFAKIITKGHLGYFIATQRITYYSSPYYPSYYYDPYMSYEHSSAEVHHYIIDFSTGKVYDFSSQSMSEILKDSDPMLYQQFVGLSRRKQKKLVFYYLRLFNKRNPLYLTIKKQ